MRPLNSLDLWLRLGLVLLALAVARADASGFVAAYFLAVVALVDFVCATVWAFRKLTARRVRLGGAATSVATWASIACLIKFGSSSNSGWLLALPAGVYIARLAKLGWTEALAVGLGLPVSLMLIAIATSQAVFVLNSYKGGLHLSGAVADGTPYVVMILADSIWGNARFRRHGRSS